MSSGLAASAGSGGQTGSGGVRGGRPLEAGTAGLSELISSRIRDVPDYPQPGVLFKDITPLLADGPAFAAVVTALAGPYGHVDKVVGIEARGFILAAPVACRLGAGFVPVRKQGKLPAQTIAESYQLEYGTATVEVHADAFAPGDRVLVVDDVLATGGTAAATASLVRRSGAQVAAIAVMLELGFLDGRARLPGFEVRSLLTV
ncbi:MAG TPA: adenine phosphoribosyltransferase [Streptosporangiaceae bacterium]|jgi:adenine phosphoribosyltransferase|nr:adenine phosphoribosyltransferase [Streptosporangiaceae bacterium]